MSTVLPGDRQRLTDLMNYSLAKQGLTWEQVARQGGPSVPQLRNIRNGGTLTLRSKVRIERGLNWPDGSVDGVLRNDRAGVAAIRAIGVRAIEPPRFEPNSREFWEYVVRNLPPAEVRKLAEAAKRALERSTSNVP